MMPTDKERIEEALGMLVDELERMFRYDPSSSKFWMENFVAKIRKEMSGEMGRSLDVIMLSITQVLDVVTEHGGNMQAWYEKYGDIWPEISPEARTDEKIRQFRVDRGYISPGEGES